MRVGTSRSAGERFCSTWKHLGVVLATVQNRQVGSGSGSNPEPNRCNGTYHTKTRTVAIEPVLLPETRHYKSTIFAPIKYFSSDRIVTWSVGKLCCFSPSFTSRSRICGRTNIHRVAIEIPRIWPGKWRYFTVIRWILVQSQICQREVKERLKLHNQRTDHIVIRSELKYSIGAKVAGTVIWNRSQGSTLPKHRAFMSGPGNKPTKTERVGSLDGSRPGPRPSGRFQPGPKPGNPEPLRTLPCSPNLKPGRAGNKSRSTDDKPGSPSNHMWAVWEKLLLMEWCWCAWRS